MPDEMPILQFDDADAWERWLDAEHANSNGVWLRLAKKAASTTTVTRPEALDVALCYGWIDAQARSEGAEFWLQKFTPRRSRSMWSKINVEKVAALEAAGRMKPAGRAEVERAKADGRWDAAYASPKNIAVPEDLEAALAENPAAKEFFATLTGNNRYAILFRIQDAKRPETRARRIAKFVDMLSRGETLH